MGTLLSVPMPSYVPVPTGVLWAKQEIIKPPRHLAALKFNLRHWSRQEKGGHFFAFEQPELMAADVRLFFLELIDLAACKAHPPLAGQDRPAEKGKYVLLATAAVTTALAVLRVRSRL